MEHVFTGCRMYYTVCEKALCLAGATDIALQADRPDVLSDVCKSMRNIARLSDRAALYI